MNVTPPNSGTASTQAASPLPQANSSLADFLLAGSPPNSGEDFRTIAAALFGGESTTASPAQAQEPAAANKKMASPQDKTETRKSKEGDDPSSAAAHPELTVPLPAPPAPWLDPGSKLEVATGPLGLPDINVSLKDTTILVGRKLSGSEAGLPEAPQAAIPPSSLNADKQELPTIESELQKKLPLDHNLPLVEPLANTDGGTPATAPAARLFAFPETNPAAKKNAVDGSDQPANADPAKQVPPQATGASPPAPTLQAPVAANPSPAMTLAAASLTSATLPSASLLELSSPTSASETLDKSMTAKLAQASGPADPTLTAGSSDGSLFAKPAASSKIRGPEIKDRDMKDRDIKDTRTTSTQRGKIEHAEAANLADGIIKSAATNSKDVAGAALGTHSDPHAKAIPLKLAVAAQSQTAVADADGPDEALPTSTPSPVTTAKLVHAMSQSEFRVGMQTPEFGNIDIRTSVARHMFSAQISVEHSEVAKSMTADLPALYHKLADQQVPVASIVIQGQSFATSSGLAQDSQQPQTWRPQGYNATNSEAETALPVLMETLDSAGRLDIRI